jgi:hypothetical protein
MRASLVAALLLLAVVTAQSPQAPAEDDGNDADLDQTGPDDEPAEVKIEQQDAPQCPSSGGHMCSGKGKCEVTEESTVVCNCDAGYHGEDCSEMDDKFDGAFNNPQPLERTPGRRQWHFRGKAHELTPFLFSLSSSVFWNSIMLKSKNAVLKPKFERASRRFNQLDNRVKAYNKRVTADVTEERVSSRFFAPLLLCGTGSRNARTALDRVGLSATWHTKTSSSTRTRKMLTSTKRLSLSFLRRS